MGRAFEYRKATIMARNLRLAKAFTKAGKQITIAVKAAGPDPETNSTLRRAIQNAKAVSMPKDKIENAIKKAMGKDTSNYDELSYDGMGPHGIAVVVDCATDNATRTIADVRAIFRKCGGEIGKTGMHDFLFDRKGVFFIELDKIEDPEEFELEYIDHGLEELTKDKDEEDEEYYMCYCAFEDFGKLQDGLEKGGIEAKKTELQRIPAHYKEDLTEEQIQDVLKLIGKLEENDDVTSIFHNMG